MAYDFIRGSIRKKLILLVILATFPVFAVLLISEFEDRNTRLSDAEHETLITLRGFSEVQRRVTDSTRTLLGTIAELPEFKHRQMGQVRQSLTTLLKANPIYTNVIFVDLEGDVLAMGRGKDKGFNFKDRKQFRDALYTGEFAAGEYVVGKQSNKSIFPFGAPVMGDDGEPNGAIIIGVDLTHLETLYDKFEMDESAYLEICDQKGTRVFRYPPAEGLSIGLPVKEDVYRVAKNSGNPGFTITEKSDGMECVVAFDPLRLSPGEESYMYMFLGADRSAMLVKSNRVLIRSFVVGILSLVFAVGLAWLLAWRSIGAKIDRLGMAARQLGQGKECTSCGLDYDDGEIGALAKSFDTMSDLLKKRENDLLVAKELAESANRAKDEFLANISHEVRTPLNGVMGMLQLLRDTGVDKKQDSYLDTALQSSRNLLRVLNDLLDFIKVGVGKMELIHEVFDIEELIDQSANLFRLQLEQKGIEFETYIYPEAIGYYYGDAGRIRQILFNLLGNAIKFTEEGSIRIEVYTLPHPDKKNVRLFFSVEDTGVGIPDDKTEYVFDAFTQVDGSLSRRHQGTGLGLPIVKNLVNLMNGNCVVESELGVGTTVLFCVQVMPAKDALEEVDVPAISIRDINLRILLVEDEAVNRIMAQKLIENMGHTVFAAENGQECLDFLAENPVDIVLMDIQMPVMDGLKAARAIRVNEGYAHVKNVPIIALSAHAADFDKERAFDAGIDFYMVKPFEKAEMEQTLSKAVELMADRLQG